MAIIENGRRTPSYQQNGARRNQALGLKAPAGQTPTSPLAPRPAAPPAVAATQPTPPSNYDALFRASIDAQRGQIDSQLRAAMGALAAREQNANALVARQPGEVEANYGQAQPALDALRNTAESTQGQLNVRSLDQPGAAMNPIIAAVAGEKASRLSDAPYLQAGTSELFTRQRGALDQAGLEARSGLETQLQDYYQQNALREAAAKQDEDTFYAHTLFQRGLDREDAAAAEKGKRKEEKRLLDASEPPAGTAEWWKWNMQRNPNRAEDFAGGHLAKYAQQQVTKGLARVNDEGKAQFSPASINHLLQKYAAPRYSALRSYLKYQGRNIPKGKKSRVYGLREGSGGSSARREQERAFER